MDSFDMHALQLNFALYQANGTFLLLTRKSHSFSSLLLYQHGLDRDGHLFKQKPKQRLEQYDWALMREHMHADVDVVFK